MIISNKLVVLAMREQTAREFVLTVIKLMDLKEDLWMFMKR